MSIPELLSPAGSLKAMRLAFAYGADAVYAGQPRFSLRVRNNEFDLEHLAVGIAEAHALGKRFYVVANIAPHNAKVERLVAELAPVIELQPDALIVSDPGVVWLLRQHYPDMPLHLSVQANTVNWAAVKFWQVQGIERVILSRELALAEIAEIRQRVPEMELEVFVHGALCMAYSGRCLLSGYGDRRDPNQGACTNACRWRYQVHDAKQDDVGQWQPRDAVLLEDKNRPGELMTLDEDEHGSYIMNSRDLRAIEHVDALTRMGVHSLKIEGRTKSPYYVARTAQVYRRAIDAAVAGEVFNPAWLEELDGLANRGYTEGFLRRHIPTVDLQNYSRGHSVGQQQWVGEVMMEDITSNTFNNQRMSIDVKNHFEIGDELVLMTPAGNHNFRLGKLYNAAGEPVATAPGSGHIVQIPRPITGCLDHALLIKNLAS